MKRKETSFTTDRDQKVNFRLDDNIPDWEEIEPGYWIGKAPRIPITREFVEGLTNTSAMTASNDLIWELFKKIEKQQKKYEETLRSKQGTGINKSK